MAVASPTNAPLQRSFALLRRLQRGPATRDELVEYVHVSVDASAYADIAQKELTHATGKTPALAAQLCYSPLSTIRSC